MAENHKSQTRTPRPAGFVSISTPQSLEKEIEKKRPRPRGKFPSPVEASTDEDILSSVEPSKSEDCASSVLATHTNNQDLLSWDRSEVDQRQNFHDAFKQLNKSYVSDVNYRGRPSNRASTGRRATRGRVPFEGGTQARNFYPTRHPTQQRYPRGSRQLQTNTRQPVTAHSDNELLGAKTYEDFITLKGRAEKAKSDALSLEVQRYNEASFLGGEPFTSDGIDPRDQVIPGSELASTGKHLTSSVDLFHTSPQASSHTLSDGVLSRGTLWSSSMAETLFVEEDNDIPNLETLMPGSKLFNKDVSGLGLAETIREEDGMKLDSSASQVTSTRELEDQRRQQILYSQQLKQLAAFTASKGPDPGQSG